MSHGQYCFRSDGDWVCGGGCTDERDERESDKSAHIAKLTAERDALAGKLEEAKGEIRGLENRLLNANHSGVNWMNRYYAEQARAEEATRRVEGLRTALESIESGLGDRLLAQGPLSEPYAHAILRRISTALASPAPQSPAPDLSSFVRDLADHGVRHDMCPTIGNYDRNRLIEFYTNYIQSIDRSIRHRALAALAPQSPGGGDAGGE